MRILAFDAALAACSAAVWDSGVVVAQESVEAPRGHAEILAPLVARVMARAGGGFGALDRLAVTVGPGHFTGLRAGLAAARAMALASGKQLVGVTTLAAVADSWIAQAQGAPLLVALDSKRVEAYAQLFAPDGTPLGGPLLGSAADIVAAAAPALSGAPTLALVGDAAAAVAPAFASGPVAIRSIDGFKRIDAAAVARLAAAAPAGAPPPRPLYLHAPAISAPEQDRARLRPPVAP